MLHTDIDMIKNLWKYTAHPKFIRVLAQEFIRKFLNENENGFIGIHWRFNYDDFLIGDQPSEDDLDKFIKNKKRRKRSPNPVDPTFDKKNGFLAKKGLTSEIMEDIYRTMQDPYYFLDRFIPHVEKNFEKKSTSKPPQKIFISSPTTVSSKFSKNLKIQNYQIITGQDTKKFLKEKIQYLENILR